MVKLIKALWNFVDGYKTYFLVAVQAGGNAYMMNKGYTADQIAYFNLIMSGLIGTNKAIQTKVDAAK